MGAALAQAESRRASQRGAPDKPTGDAFEQDLIALIPYLKNFSRVLCGKSGIGTDVAEDITQEALAKAWRARDRFEPGTNLKAWVFTILLHEFYSYTRRSWRQTSWDADFGEQIPAPVDEQLWAMSLSDCTRALKQVPRRQREAVLLVGVGGFSYEDAANLLGAPVGTLKSRAARGRSILTKILADERLLMPRSVACAQDATNDILAQLAAVEATSRAAPK